MDTTLIQSIASIVLGIIALAIPVLTIFVKKSGSVKTVLASLGAGSISIVIQVWYLRYCVNIGDLSSVIDTINALAYVAALFAGICIVLNTAAVLL